MKAGCWFNLTLSVTGSQNGYLPDSAEAWSKGLVVKGDLPLFLRREILRPPWGLMLKKCMAMLKSDRECVSGHTCMFQQKSGNQVINEQRG